MVLDFFRNIFCVSSSFTKIPVVRAAADDDEEEELVDPQEALRTKCKGQSAALALRSVLDECNKRVRSRKKTKETCEEEFFEWMQEVEKCVSKDIFSYLK